MIEVTSSRDDVRSRIVAVAARLLHEHGPAAVTTRGVAEGAGVQAPAIYRFFGDKDGLLDAVAEQVLATYVSAKAAIVAAADDVDPLEDLRAGWRMQLDFGVANPAVFRLLSDPDRASNSPAARSGMAVLAARVHRVAQAGRLRVGEQRAVGLIHAAGVGAIQTLVTTPPDQRDHGVADALFEAVLAQIVTDEPAAGDDAPLAAAVTLRALTSGLEVLTDAERRLLTEWLDRVVVAGQAAGR